MTLDFQEVEAPTISRQSAYVGGKVVSPPHRPHLPLRYTRYSFLLELSRPPGPWYGRKDEVNEKSQLPHRHPNPLPSGL